MDVLSLIPTPASIDQAAADLEPVLRPTPAMTSSSLAPLVGRQMLHLKPENLQRTGSFKFRGAYTKVHRLAPHLGGRGIVTYSSGNHGQAVALAAALHGVKAIIVLPEDAVPDKVEATLAYGAEIIRAGHTSLERKAAAEDIAASHGWPIVHAFDDPDIIAGQATVGREIALSVPDTDGVLVPVGGGGLASGISLALSHLRPGLPVFGVEPEGANDAFLSLSEHHLVTLDHPQTLADGLRTSRIGDLNFEILSRHLAGIITVSEASIRKAVRLLAQRAKLVVEPSGAVGLAALLEGKGAALMSPTLVLSGGNVSAETLAMCLTESS